MKLILACWTCGRDHDASEYPADQHGIKCDCGGFIVSPSGKVIIKKIEMGNQNGIQTI